MSGTHVIVTDLKFKNVGSYIGNPPKELQGDLEVLMKKHNLERLSVITCPCSHMP